MDPLCAPAVGRRAHHAGGDYAQAAALHAEALAGFRAQGDTRGIVFALSNLGSTFHLQGDDARAVALYHEALARCRDLGEPWPVANQLLLLGAIAGTGGEWARAGRLIGAADAITGGDRAPPLSVRPPDPRPRGRRGAIPARATSASPGRGGRRLLPLEAAIGEATMVTAPAPTADPADTGRATASPLGLTARELEVLELLVAGHSNAEIAGALFVSLATARTHVPTSTASWAWPTAPRRPTTPTATASLRPPRRQRNPPPGSPTYAAARGVGRPRLPIRREIGRSFDAPRDGGAHDGTCRPAAIGSALEPGTRAAPERRRRTAPWTGGTRGPITTPTPHHGDFASSPTSPPSPGRWPVSIVAGSRWPRRGGQKSPGVEALREAQVTRGAAPSVLAGLRRRFVGAGLVRTGERVRGSRRACPGGPAVAPVGTEVQPG